MTSIGNRSSAMERDSHAEAGSRSKGLLMITRPLMVSFPGTAPSIPSAAEFTNQTTRGAIRFLTKSLSLKVLPPSPARTLHDGGVQLRGKANAGP